MFCNYLIAKDFAVHLFIFSNHVVKQQNQKVLIYARYRVKIILMNLV